jgi:hypothetical protein
VEVEILVTIIRIAGGLDAIHFVPCAQQIDLRRAGYLRRELVDVAIVSHKAI